MTTILKPGLYRHFKGSEYQVIDVATHSETEEKMVVYRPLYGEMALWVRPLAMFTETIERDGKTLTRFEYAGPMSTDKISYKTVAKFT